MKNKFQSLTEKGRWLLATLTLLFTLGIGQMWAAEIYSWTVSSALAKDASADATGGTVSCTGSAMGSETPSSSGFFKFNSSTKLTFTLSSGTFAAGDVISFTFTSGGNNKTVGVEIQETSPVTQLTETVATKGTSVTKTYTVVASDGIQGQNKFSIKRVDSNFSFKSVSVTRSSGDTPVCPETLTISSKDSKTAFTEGDKIELTAALAKGNGTITYQWYKGSVAAGNAISGATSAKYEKANCTTADAGDYFCVASKADCSDAVNASAFAITVAADTKCFNMPEITSKPADLASVTVTGGTLSDVSTAKSVAMNAAGLKLDGNSVYLKVSLASASIVEGTKITVAWKGAGDGAGIALVNENLEHKVIDLTGISDAAGSISHTFTAAEAANYADEFIIHRNASGTGIYVNAITVEDCGSAVVKHTITLNYNDDVTDNGSIKVVHGNAATQPADPERGKYTFLGWFVGDTDNEYVWSSAVNDDITLKAHWLDPWTITFDANGGSAVADITVKHNTKADKPADPTREDYDFDGWLIGDTDTPFDWNANVVTNYSLKAHWTFNVAKYDIEYYDGETKIGTEEQVRVDQHPTAAGINTNKPLYTFDGWFLNSALTGDPVALNTVTPSEGLKIYGKWSKAYGNNVDFEAYIHANNSEKDDVDKAEAYVLSQNYALSTKTGTTFDANSSTNNGAYEGLKIKNSGTILSWNVAAGKVVEFKAGVMVANGSLSINGGAATTIDGGTTGTGDNFKIHYFYSAAEALYTFTTSNGSAEVVKAITMRAPYQVSFDENDGDPVAAQYAYPSVTLPDATNGTASLLGWFDDATAGNKIGEAGESYTPTANITLYAHWEAISTDNTLSDLKVGGVTVDGFSPAVHTYFYELPYGTAVADIPEISATANSAKAKQVAIQQAVWTGEPYNCYRAQANVQAEDESWGYYDVRFSFAPKDGVSLIKVATTGGTNKTVTGAYAGDGDVNLSSSKKMDGGKYIGFTLDGTTLQAGDRINVHTSQAANTGGSHIIFYDNMTDKNELYDTEEIGGTGDNIFTINAAMVGSATAYVYRANNDAAHQWNGYVDYIEVTRAMDPVLTAITLDGVAADKDSEFAFSATLPNGTNLASMTVVPTVIWNGAGATAPTAAWAWGANTYRVEDKDGDYTNYTITLTEAAAPSAAPVITAQPAGDDYIEGETIAALEVVATGESLTYQWYLGADAIDGATEATYTPAVSAIGSYVYHCVVTNTEAGHPATSLASDNATITIAEDPAAIKLLDGEGNINTSDFITGVSKNTVTYGEVEHNCATFGSTASTAVGASGLNKFIIYNAKTDQTKIKFVLYNTQNGAVTMKLQKLVEGGTEMVEEVINVPSKEEYTTDYYTFNGSANRTMYAFVQNTGIKVLQVKVIDNGAPLKQFGEVGYSINFNQGRLFLNSGTDGAYDGLTYNAASNYAPLTNSGLSITKSKAYSFNVPAAATMTVTAANNAKYYITQTENGEDNETAVASASSFDLTAGTWYLRVAGSNLSVTSIAFAAPKCAEPSFAALANSDVCEGDGYVALNGTATVADAGVPTYQWYNADGDAAIDGATAAEFTPTADGSYYVIATNHLADHSDNAKQSATVTVTTFASAQITTAPADVLKHSGLDVTLSVAATGKNISYEWFACDDAEGNNPVAFAPAQTGTSLLLENIEAGVKYYKVLVSSDCGTASAVAKVEGFDDLPQVDVTETTTWNMANVSASAINLKNDYNPSKQNVRLLLANIDGVNNNASFNAQALMFEGQHIGRTSNSVKHLAGRYVQFNVTVPGMVSVTFASNDDNKERTIAVNGKKCTRATTSATYLTYDVAVEPGSVEIIGYEGNNANQYVRISKIEFRAEDNYHRTVNPSYLGTLCWTNNAVLGGATLYEFAGKNENNYLVFDEVAENRLEAGKPYIFMPENGNTQIKVYNIDDAEPLTEDQDPVNNMYGTITGKTLTHGADDNMYYFSANHIWAVKDFTVEINVPAYYCYVDYEAVLNGASAPTQAPGRRRVTMGVQGEQVATGMEQITNDQLPIKVLINGQLFILRGEKMFNANGQLVK